MPRLHAPCSLLLPVLMAAALAYASLAHGALLITNVNVIAMTGDDTPQARDILVEDGRFVRIAAPRSITPPEGAQVIDGAGRYLIPGLMDLHMHFVGRPDWQEDMAYLYLAHGVTTVLCMRGTPTILSYRAAVESGEMEGPRIFTTSPVFGNIAPTPRTPEEAIELTNRYIDAGYDFIKVYNYIPEKSYWAIMETANARDFPVVGHAVRSVGMEAAIKTGQHIAHMEEFLYSTFKDGRDEAAIRPLARELKKAGISVIANLTSYHTIIHQLDDIDAALSAPGVAYLPWSVLKYYQPDKNDYLARFDAEHNETVLKPSFAFLQTMTRILHEEGVPVLPGTDAVMPVVVPGVSMHIELQEFVDAGIAPRDTLRAATIQSAAFLGIAHEAGAIAEGMRADAVLLEANPLEDIANTRKIAGVLAKGKWHNRESIDKRLVKIREAAEASREE